MTGTVIAARTREAIGSRGLLSATKRVRGFLYSDDDTTLDDKLAYQM
jgi:hypothetical protein